MEEKRTRGGEEERSRGRGEGRRGEKEKRRREVGEEETQGRGGSGEKKGGGSNNKKDRAAGKNLRCPLSFLFFFVLFQNTFKIDVFVSNLVKNVSSKKNKKDHDFRIF